MGQTWTTDIFNKGHAYDTDMGNVEINFATLKSLFSGTSQPANAVPGMPWFDTTKKVLKIRNTGNSAWYGLMHGDTSQKIWVYRDSAMDGWAVDSTVALQDKVLAIKGGTTYTTGAATAGSWTISGLTTSHYHELASYTSASSYNGAAGGLVSYETGNVLGIHVSGGADPITAIYNFTGPLVGTSITSDGTARPAAAVGTLQYLDL